MPLRPTSRIPAAGGDAPTPKRLAARRHAGQTLDVLAFSSLLASAVGAALSLVSSRVLGAEGAWRWALLAALGTFVVYVLDRLRDVDRDRRTAPARTRFVERHRTVLATGVGVAAAGILALLWTAPFPIQMLCAGIGALGLLHRRLKRRRGWKTAYVSAAWVAVCVGIPWLAAERPLAGFGVAASLGLVLAANLMASSLRDGESTLRADHPWIGLGLALGLALAGAGLAALGPDRLRPLLWIGLLEGLALLGFRPDERYGLVVVDGALLVGSVLAWVHLAWLGGGGGGPA